MVWRTFSIDPYYFPLGKRANLAQNSTKGARHKHTYFFKKKEKKLYVLVLFKALELRRMILFID